jgi:hypothetical protein
MTYSTADTLIRGRAGFGELVLWPRSWVFLGMRKDRARAMRSEICDELAVTKAAGNAGDDKVSKLMAFPRNERVDVSFDSDPYEEQC